MKLSLFTYGTLRPGGRNYDEGLFQGVTHIPNVTVEGRLFHSAHFSPAHPGFPGARFDRHGTIHGDIFVFDLLTLDQVGLWYGILNMECGARYTPVYVRASVGSRVREVVSFRYDGPEGEEIESGDWFTEVPRVQR